MEEGAKPVVVGGLGRPEGTSKGFMVKNTVFSAVCNAMQIARQEIFGPVVCIIPYDSIDEAIEIANDSEYGLAAYVQCADLAMASSIARRLNAGTGKDG